MSDSPIAVEGPPENGPAAAPPNSLFRDILSRYDVHQISPREFSELVQKLLEGGEITQADAQDAVKVMKHYNQNCWIGRGYTAADRLEFITNWFRYLP